MSIGQGALRVTLGYPSGPFTDGYREATPRLSVDGVERREITWGADDIVLPTGPHAIKILVYAHDGDAFGLAETSVTVELGKTTELHYKAPRFHGSHGKVKVIKP